MLKTVKVYLAAQMYDLKADFKCMSLEEGKKNKQIYIFHPEKVI